MFVRKHIFLFIVAILLIFAILLPNLFLISTSKGGNWPLTINTKLAYMEEETYIYASHVYQIINGYFIGDAYIWEYRVSPSPFLGELASIIPIAILAEIAGSVPLGFTLSDLFFPAFLLLLIFYFLKKFDYSENFSIASSLAVITIPFLSMLFPHISSFGTQLTGDETNAMFFSRTPHPQISSIYLFGALFATAQVLKNPTVRLISIWAVILGLSLYSSPFVSSTVFLASLLISPILLKRISKKTFAVSLAIIGLTGLPYILNIAELQKVFTGSDFLLRTTFPVEFLFPRYLRYLAVAVLLFKFKKDALSWTIIAYVAAAVLLVDGHQIISGRNLEADHWISRVLAPISTLSIFLIINKFTQNFNSKRINIFWIGTSFALITIAFSKQFTWINANLDQFKIDNLETLSATIQKETKKDDVIGSLDPQIEKHITGLTGRRVYLAPGDRTVANASEQIERICDLARLSTNPSVATSRRVINYALGFEVWFKKDVGDIEKQIKECRKEPKANPAYKLDYFVEENPESKTWNLEKVNGETF